MSRIKKILVPVDFSGSSVAALDFAVDLARRYDAELLLLHAYHAPGVALPEGVVLAAALVLASVDANAERELLELKAGLERQGFARVTTKALIGAPATEIVEQARVEGADLVVMGSHGRTGLLHALVGSVAEAVVRKAHCPVLVVRSAPPAK